MVHDIGLVKVPFNPLLSKIQFSSIFMESASERMNEEFSKFLLVDPWML